MSIIAYSVVSVRSASSPIRYYEWVLISRIMGYEYSAEVVEAGADVGRFVPSDKVIEEPTYDYGQYFQVRTVNRTCARTFPSPGSTVTGLRGVRRGRPKVPSSDT
jgi:threonine dehydrogenase-like Zn-dependent dehydrogenase